MNSILRKLIIIPVVIILFSCNAPGGNNTNTMVSIKTTLGEIKIKLYDNTPLHRDNFIKLINSGIYDNVSFHRVIRDFMIQTGDPLTRPAPVKAIPDSLNTYTIQSEINYSNFHKKGALAAARKGNSENPQMRSSGTQFYIVQGTKYSDEELDQAETQINNNLKQALFSKLMKETADSLLRSGKTSNDSEIQEIASIKMFDYLTQNKNYRISEEQRTIYKAIGGVPRLDATYTVFGEVTDGLDVIDRIAAVPTGSNDRPIDDIRILKIKIIR